MIDLEERLRGVDQAPVPDLWNSVRARAATDVSASSAPHLAWRRPLTILVAFAVFAVAVGASFEIWTRASRGPADVTPTQSTSPSPTQSSLTYEGLRILRTTRTPGWVVLADPFGIWVAGGGTLSQVDPASGEVHQTATGSWDYDSVGMSEYGEGTIFVYSGSDLLMMDSRSGTLIRRYDLSSIGRIYDVLDKWHGKWVLATGDGTGAVLAQLNFDTGTIARQIHLPGGSSQLAAASGYLFVDSPRSDGSELLRIDPRSGTITPGPPGLSVISIAATGSTVWTASGQGVSCVDAISLLPCGDVSIPRASVLSSDGRNVWVLSPTGSKSASLYVPDPSQPATVTLIDGVFGDVLAGPLALNDTTPATISAFDGHAWVGFHDSQVMLEIGRCHLRSCVHS
ncbi:MAG: hypothetical protein ABJA81_03810 [Nocardioidaceae bacterium]